MSLPTLGGRGDGEGDGDGDGGAVLSPPAGPSATPGVSSILTRAAVSRPRGLDRTPIAAEDLRAVSMIGVALGARLNLGVGFPAGGTGLESGLCPDDTPSVEPGWRKGNDRSNE